MDHPYRFLDEKNALAILPIPESCLQEIEGMLEAIDRGERGGSEGCIARLIQINKRSRFSTKSWGRLAGSKKVDLGITFRFINFDEQDDYSKYFHSYDAWAHGTPQAPMLMLSFERNSGSPPVGTLENAPGTYVISRRVVSVPLQCVLKHWGNVESGYMIYEHNLSAMDHAVPQFDSISYVGLTSRNWQTRYKEHQRDALTGSELLFHTSLAAVINKDGISQIGMGPFEIVRRGACLVSELQYVNLTYEEAMRIEERMVESTLHPLGLNMIPGGFAGMRFLHKLGYLPRERATVDDRDFAAARYLLTGTGGAKIAPWVSENWSKDEFYEQVIFKRSNTLNREQVLSIRKYGNDWGLALN
ncbi:MAG: hypothetical protein ACRCWJ_07310 [Casimicrobium sp.]